MNNLEIKKKKNNERGQVMLITVILFVGISLIITLGLINPILRNIKTSSDLLSSKQSLFLSDSGVRDAIYRLKNSLSISDAETLSIDGYSSLTNIEDSIDGKNITSVTDYRDFFRKIEVKMLKGFGVSFFYGVQVGNGGFTLSGNSQVNGNIYSNGRITGGVVTGSAVSAGPNGWIEDVHVGEMAHAHTVKGSDVSGDLRCKSDIANNKTCDTSYADPAPINMPISENDISKWKSEAAQGETYIGDYVLNKAKTLGPIRITGNLDINDILTMNGTIWVEGILSFSSKGRIALATSTYGNKSGVIIVDKHASFSGGSGIVSTGVPGSFVMLLVTSDCPTSGFCSGRKAISASGNADSIVLAAPYGEVSFGGNSSAKEVIAEKISTIGSVVIDYEVGMANLNFVSGPSGGYTISSFREKE